MSLESRPSTVQAATKVNNRTATSGSVKSNGKRCRTAVLTAARAVSTTIAAAAIAASRKLIKR